MFGRRARLPLTKMLYPIIPLIGRLQDLFDNLQQARAMSEESRMFNRERLARQANTGEIYVGDSVVIKANEPLTITSSWDSHWTVTQVRGKVVYVRHEPSSKTKVLNRDKVQIVEPEVNWDDINPRPARQSNKSDSPPPSHS